MAKPVQRSKLDGHFAGIGTNRAFVENETMYEDQKVINVRFPSDQLKGASLVAMSGPVDSYNLANVIRLKPDCEVCGIRMEPMFLQPWNGQERVCKPCITEYSGEVPDAGYGY